MANDAPELEQEQTEQGTEPKEAKKQADEETELTPEQLEAIQERKLTKMKKWARELGFTLSKKEEKKEEEREKADDKPTETGTLGYAERAYLKAEQVPEEDFEWLQEESEDTGKPYYELLKFNYVKEELKKRADARKVEDAIPSGSKRTGSPPRDTADYWLAKVESGDKNIFDVPQNLRKEVLQKRQEYHRKKDKFAPNPIV